MTQSTRRLIVAGALMVLGVAALLFYVPRLLDQLRYEGVDSQCSGRIGLSGVASGRHCVAALTVNRSETRSFLSAQFAGQGHLIVYLDEPLVRDGQPRSVRHALVRMPGEDGGMFCAEAGTIHVDKDFAGGFELTAVRELVAAGDVTLSVDKAPTREPRLSIVETGAAARTDLATFVGKTQSSNDSSMRLALTGAPFSRDIFVRAGEPLTGQPVTVLEALVLTQALGGSTTRVGYGFGDAGTAGWDRRDEGALALRFKEFGVCGSKAAGTGSLEASWSL